MQSKTLFVLSAVAILAASSTAMANGAQVYSHHYRHSRQYIVVPQYYNWRRDYLPYWGPQDFYQSPFGPER